MKRRHAALISFVLVILWGPVAEGVNERAAQEAYGALSLSFEANHGQADEGVTFLSRATTYTLLLTRSEAVLALRPGNILRMRLVGANAEPQIKGLDPLAGRTNYFIGNDRTKWRTNIPTYGKVEYRSVYPGIDLVYYGNRTRLEYDFVVAPGADPGVIALTFEGADSLELAADGHLLLKTAGGDVRLDAPHVYQVVDGRRQPVTGSYVLGEARTVGFRVAAYDATKPLVIDPVLIYSTLLGGNDTDQAYGIAVDSFGNAYVTGSTSSTMFDGPNPGLVPANDVFVAKLNPTGSALVYATYLGGSGSEGQFFRIAVDHAGHAYVTGGTDSHDDFPGAGGGTATKVGSGGDIDAFVVKLTPDGSAIVYSALVGGTKFERPFGIAVDASGRAYVAGQTRSPDFFTTDNAYDRTCGTGPDCSGAADAFVTKLSFNAATSELTVSYSTYLGGTMLETNLNGRGVAVNDAGHVFVAGRTGSPDFPLVNQLTVDSANGINAATGEDVFVTKLNTNPATCTPVVAQGVNCQESLVYSTLLGGSGEDGTNTMVNLAVDGAGKIYVTGKTKSSDFPTTPDAISTNCFDASFAAKLDPDQAGDSSLVYSTCQVGDGASIAVDFPGNVVYLDTTLLDLVQNMPVAYPPGFGGLIALDAVCSVYAAGTSGAALPLTGPFGPFQDTLLGGSDAYVQKIGSKGGPLAFIPNTNAGTVSVIDTASNDVVATVPVNGAPGGVAVGLDGRHAWVGTPPFGVSVIDVANNYSVSVIPPGQNVPTGIVVTGTPDPAYPVKAFVGYRNAAVVGVIDANPASATFKQHLVIPFIQVFGFPQGVTASPDGSKVYVVANNLGLAPGVITVIDAVTYQTQTFPLPPELLFPIGVDITPDGSHLIVAGGDTQFFGGLAAGAIGVIKTSDYLPGAPIVTDAGGVFAGVAIAPDGSRAYVTQPHGGKVLVLNADPVTAGFGALVGPPIAVGGGSFGISVHPDGRRVYVANGLENTVSVIDVETVVTPISNVEVQAVTVGTMPAAFGPRFITRLENPDVDGDGIWDLVDGTYDPVTKTLINASATNTFTTRHLRGSVFGEIVSAGDLTVGVESPAGLVVRTTGTAGEAEIKLCDITTKFYPGSVVAPLHCGSLTARVVSGSLDVLLGSLGVASVPSGVTFRVAEIATDQFEIRYLDGMMPIQVAFQGRVTEVGPGRTAVFPEPTGRMRGIGHLDAGGRRHHFEFEVAEHPSGQERGRLEYRAPALRPGRDRGKAFVSSTVTMVTFSNDSVVFSGIGQWNGRPGYAFTARAVDAGAPGPGHDQFTITIADPSGAIVATVGGTLRGGNIRAQRAKR